MKKYKVNFGGFAYVEAEDEDDAREKFEDDYEIYREDGITSVEEVECFGVII